MNALCIDCGGKVSLRSVKRCWGCFVIYRKQHGGPMLGKHQSEVAKEKLRKFNTGKVMPKEVRDRMVNSMRGKNTYLRTEETKEKMSNGYIYHINSGCFKKGQFAGSKHPNWNGGVSSLRDRIRSAIEYKVWRNAVYKRDNYICQECFTKGCRLHAHHKKPFTLILKEFLVKYSQFSPIDDIDILVRLSLSYQEFWDVNIGITYCSKCHKEREILCQQH